MNVFIHGSLNEQRLSSAFLLKLYLNKINNSNSEWLFNPYPSGKHLFLMTMWCDNLNIERRDKMKIVNMASKIHKSS